MPVTVKWGKERITFDLPSPDTKLSTIRKSLAEYTHLPQNAFKLIHAGATMRDDHLPISAYHLRPNSVIVLIGSDNPTPTVPASLSSPSSSTSSPSPSPHNNNNNNNNDAPPTPTTRMDPKSISQQSTISQIHSELTKVREELAPGVELYLTNAGASGGSGSNPHHGRQHPNAYPQQHQQHQQQQRVDQGHAHAHEKEKEKEKEKERTRLSELLLQSLLRLDGITAPSSAPSTAPSSASSGGSRDAGESRDDIRRERKEAVKEVQGLLDRLDGGGSQS